MQTVRNSMSLKQISMTDLYRKASQLGAAEVVLDVRSPGEFSAGHVKGSLNIPHDQLAGHFDALRKYAHIYIHCRSGKRAEAAAQILLKAGFNNRVCITGSGMDDWVAAGFPVEKA
jgi:rhodanese-related sulfurtransferase